MSIIYNTFRKDKYLRTLFTQSRYLLASENTDLELEIFDFIRHSFRNNIGDVAIGNAWQVTVYSANQLLVSPGEAWYDGLPFHLSMGDDWILTLGNTPSGVTLSDAPGGIGKLITFTTTTTPSAKYRVVINASEQIIDSTEDPFLQNINVPEPTASKIRLVYTINLVLDSNQGASPFYDQSSPIPYQGEIGSYSAVNLSNTIKVTPSSTSGYLISIVDVTGSSQIDGRSVELTIANPTGVNPFPTGSNDQAAFENGTFFDALGSEYHINAIFNGTTSGQVVVRLSNQVGQADPVIPNNAGSPTGFVPYYFSKQDVYYTDDSTGLPTGVLHWHTAQATWDTNNGFIHPSVVKDLRNRVVSEEQFEELTNAKFVIKLTSGGTVSLGTDAQTLTWSLPFNLINPAGPLQVIAANTAVLVNGGTLTYTLNTTAGGTISKGNLVTSVVSNAGNIVSFTNSPTPNLAAVTVGNVIKVGSQTTYVTAINNATISGSNPNVTVTVATPITNTGAATIYLDSYGPGTVNLNENTYTLAVLNNGQVVVGDALFLGAGESNSTYDERTLFPSGLTTNTNIVLPTNSITGLPQFYDSVHKKLQVFVNQLFKFQGIDWIAVDSQTIQFNYALPANAEVHFRIETFPAGSVGGGSDSGNTLQTAYNNGNTIVTNSGNPFTVSGSSAKVAAFLGDIEVTGIVDPSAVQLSPQSTNPLSSGQYGIWSDTSGDLIYEGSTEVNITSSIAALESAVGATKVTMGESLLANTSYIVRWALFGQTSGTVYRANAADAANNQYLGIGIVSSTSAITSSSLQNITTNGSYSLASLDTPFASSDIGKAVFLKNDGSGGFTTTPTTNVGDAQFRIGVVESPTSIWVDFKDLSGVVPVPTYDERILYPSGLAASTNITIPLNSRNSNTQETYSTTGGDLKVFANQLFKFQGIDWTAIDDQTIAFTYALPNDTEVHFRKEMLSAGILSGGGGGGGSGSLQDSYNVGNSITTVTGVPVTLNGPSGQKLLQINGNMGITGVVDPTAIQFIPQSSNPLSGGQSGLWMNTSSQLMSTDGIIPTNIGAVIASVVAGTAQTTISNTYINSTGSTIPIFTPVYTPTSGQIDLADGTNSSKFRVLGLTLSAINNSSTGLVAYTGYVSGVGSLTHGAYVYLGLTPGTLVDVGPTLGPYPSGFNVVKIGIMDGTNLILQIQSIGTL